MTDISDWTEELSCDLQEKPGEQSVVPAMVANGWRISSRIPSSSTDSSAAVPINYVLKREYVDFGEVLSTLYSLFEDNYDTEDETTTASIMELIVALDAGLDDVSASVTGGTATGGTATGGTATGGTASNATGGEAATLENTNVTPISAGWFPEIDEGLYGITIENVSSPQSDIDNALLVAEDAIDLARISFTEKIRYAADLVDTLLDKYKGEMQDVGEDYNPKIQDVLDEFINDFIAYQDTVSDELDDWGVSEKAVIDLAFTTERSKREAEMIDKHTHNSLTWGPISSGIEREHQMALTNLSDKLVERRINLEKDLYGSQEKARADLISGLESMRSNDLQEISTIIPHIMKEVDVLSQAYTNYLNTVGSQEIQTAGMTIDSLLKVYDVEVRMAQFESDHEMKGHELTLRVKEIKSQLAQAKASAFTSENSSIRNYASSIASSKNSLSASKYGADTSASVATANNATSASVATANNATSASVATANNATSANVATANNTTSAAIQQASLDAQGVMNQNSLNTQMQGYIADAYKLYMASMPKLSDLAAILGAATSIEGVE